MSNPTAAALADFRRGDLVKRTTSICPACLRRVDAEVRQRGSAVWMDKACPDHGPFSALLASDARHYWPPSVRAAARGVPAAIRWPTTAATCSSRSRSAAT